MTILLIVVIVIVLYLFLIAPRMWNRADRSAFMNWHYAHRGLFQNYSDAPENSLAAFHKAVKAGYGIEFDVQLSKDNKPVIFHDASLKRMCGVDGKVWEYTLEELKQFSLLESKQKIPTLEEALDIVDGKVPLIIEYKLDRVQTQVCKLSDKILQKYQGVYCVECFHPLALAWYRKHRPHIMRGQLWEEHFRNEPYKGNPIFFIMSYLLPNVWSRPDFIAFNHKHAYNISRRLCRLMGGLSIAYTIKSETEYQKAKKEFDLFIFDSFLMREM